METILGSFPIPFQRRLTKIYRDCTDYEFVKEPIHNAQDPDLQALHRKLRIQKDRLITWGIEWSDESQTQDIDEKISNAGLSELVGSVMSTIKEILAESEVLWEASKRSSVDDRSPTLEKSVVDRKPSLITWDQARFEGLVRDLTMSIDTLYDLSRSRQPKKPTGIRKAASSSSLQAKSPITEERQFESTRMQTPQQIDPTSLIWPKDLKTINQRNLLPTDSSRQIVFMRRPSASTISRKTIGSVPPTLPVLLEHAPYDPIYSITGISPSMTRFERLFSGLSQAYISSNKLISGILRLIGYFEEAEHSRFCLLYALPTNFGPVDIESPSLPIPAIITLSDLLGSGSFEPSLEIKYRLAFNVATAVFDLHSKGVVHGNLFAANILFFEQSVNQKRVEFDQTNMRQSYLASFDLFSDTATQETNMETSNPLHRHPLDPRTTRYTRLTSESKSLDLYSLAMLLLEIGLWSSLTEIFPQASSIPENTAGVFQKLASRCGSLYVKAVQACWNAPEDELSQRARPDVMNQKVCWRVSKALDTCCAIDEASEDEEDNVESPAVPATPSKVQTDRTMAHVHATLTKIATKEEMYSREWSEKPVAVVKKSAAPATPKPKLRTFPSIRISQEHLNYWHTGLMPHINYVLRGFYKKYPESVEISLESIGETASKTKPTILVICTSVNKVRSILKKSLVYDKSSYGLKVCRGKVIRSRKQNSRSMAEEDGSDIKPANGEHQERPANGASIGAYIGDRHLPPVSFGGLIMVDDQPYGMTVHHMLDDPEDEEEDIEAPVLRSSARGQLEIPELAHSESSVYSSENEEFMCEFSDYDSEAFSETTDSDYAESEAESEGDDEEPGDIKGVPAGYGEEYIITQPAIDDLPSDFYPDEETRDEDHLDSHSLGEVYASSGIRRRTEDGVVHEIDWALFSFNKGRSPSQNHISRNKKYYKSTTQYPVAIAATSSLSDLEVHCMARTSGLQSGRILPGMVIVKIYGRKTPSMSYQVSGRLGVPGDSGAWVVDNEQGRACGHVLAWSSRKRSAYICPMDVLLRDIGETLGASSISLPGSSVPIYTSQTACLDEGKSLSSFQDLHDPSMEEPEAEPVILASFNEEDDQEEEQDQPPQLLNNPQPRKDVKVFPMNYSLPSSASTNTNPQKRGPPKDIDLVGGLDRLHISKGVFSQG
ncbi:hypothetical protein BP5796_10280 [Coleophoma crateriformis]|uniref:Protein kinase domain-containing protein n=1 Tax=Coleophoma crateriformis TaxID=565419 RepID=A0A3D8QV67_9HELO|nr:hypothetical protein BP5796_10280 [Coleophoma crateriformis]